VCIRFKSAIPRATVSPWNLSTLYADLANKELYSGALKHVAMTLREAEESTEMCH